jgi:hypothetical protein
MNDRPYTDEDLRTEAARIHRQFTAEPDEGLVGEVMESGHVPSVETSGDGSARTWPELLEPDGEETPEYAQAQRAVTDLIRRAADLSEWAINLGADGLEPTGHTFQLGAKGPNDDDPDQPFVRLHFAFSPDATDEERDRFAMRLTQVIAANL